MRKTIFFIVLSLFAWPSFDGEAQQKPPILIAKGSKKKFRKPSKKTKSRPKAKPRRKRPPPRKNLKRNAKSNKGKKRRGKPGLRFGIIAAGGLENVSVQNSDRDADAFSGFGFGGGLIASYPMSRCCSLWAGGGVHISNLSAQNDVAAQKISMTSIMIESGLTYRFSSSVALGGVFQYLYGLNGTYTLTSLDENIDIDTQAVINSLSRMSIGAQLIYYFSRNIFLTADAMMIASGSLATAPPEDETLENAEDPASVTFGGFTARASVGYLF